MTPFFSSAHVKWFTNVAPQKETIENILSPLFMGLALTAAIVLALLTLISQGHHNGPKSKSLMTGSQDSANTAGISLSMVQQRH